MYGRVAANRQNANLHVKTGRIATTCVKSRTVRMLVDSKDASTKDNQVDNSMTEKVTNSKTETKSNAKNAEKPAPAADKKADASPAAASKAVTKAGTTPPAKQSAKPKSPAAMRANRPTKADPGKTKIDDRTKKKGRKKTIIWSIILAVVVLMVVGGWFAVQNIGTPVNTAEASYNDMAITVFATGTITPGDSRDVYPETQGLIQTVNVSEGDIVREGDILATLDDAAARSQVAQAQAALAQARSGLAQARAGQTQATAGQSQATAGISAAEAGVDAARAGVDAAQAGLDTARAGLTSAQRTETLTRDMFNSARDMVTSLEGLGDQAPPGALAEARGAATQAEMAYEQAKAGVASARAGVASSEANLASARAGVISSRAGVDQARAARDSAGAVETGSAIEAAQAGVEAAQDGLAMAQTAVDNTVIRAPKGGKVLFAPTAAAAAAMGTGITPTSGTEIMQGSAVAPGSPLFTIVDEQAFSFTAEVDETAVRSIETSQSANITLSSYSGRTFSAVVTDIGTLAKATITGGTVFDVTLAFTEDVPDLRIGMGGDATIEVDSQQGALTIPIDAWNSEGGEDFVFLIGSDNELVRTPITIGVATETEIEVVEGLEEGDVVAMSPGAGIQLTDGMHVSPTD